MANEYLTLLDLAKFNADSRILPLIEEALVGAPELARLPSRTIPGTVFTALIRTTLPVTEFRKVNEGVETRKSAYTTKNVETFYYDGQMEMDVAAAKADSRGTEHSLLTEAQGHMLAFGVKCGSQLWYGTGTGGDVDGFPGAVQTVDSTMVVDATGTTADTCSSCWMVKTGEQFSQFVFGNDGIPTLGEWRMQTVTRSSKEMTAWKNSFEGYIGAQFVHKYFGARIKKLTEDSGKGLTDALLFQLHEKFPVAYAPSPSDTVIFMTKRSRRQLRASRTATNPTGQPAPLPTDWEGIPIVVTESLLNTEALTL